MIWFPPLLVMIKDALLQNPKPLYQKGVERLHDDKSPAVKKVSFW